MKHAGKAPQAGRKLILWTFLVLLGAALIGFVAAWAGALLSGISGFLFGLWVLFSLFCLWFFRDPDPRVPADPGAIVAPGHGKVDAVEETSEPKFLGGPCRRISIFLSLVDVHVQNAPVAGRIALLERRPGRFLNAMNPASAHQNEQVLVGFESAERPGERVAVRLIAGVLARRIVPWIDVGDRVARGERIGLIQFGSRVDLLLPLDARVRVQAGTRVKGGETIVATRATPVTE